ncbi:unnamed protein product [Adineta steineri]|uniref:EGF-like domain-containing protein n=1 Tax=Adineta steineri TaxID=433720 RepID=A0A813V858_9BILA|nr:unnamed protein product [Adineta steineri]CAF0944021.1 unnamed protein product [Adineta steineri]
MYYLAVSYNQPRFNECTTWNSTGITFQPTFQFSNAYGIFIDTNNSVYVADLQKNQVSIWINNSIQPTKIISNNIYSPYSVFVTNNGDIFVDTNGRIDKWTLCSNISITVMDFGSSCFGLFVDINDTLYCSPSSSNKVMTIWLGSNATSLKTLAGTGSIGSTSTMLNNPRGIFVDINFNLYVADWGNDRVQLFQSKQSSGITVAGSTSINITIALSNPSGVVLDGDGSLFIVDTGNNRIVRSTSNGFHCIIGCNGGGSLSNQLSNPRRMAFDSCGNIYVTDPGNSRIQKFLLSINSCETTTEISSTMNINGNSTMSSTKVQHDTSVKDLTTTEISSTMNINGNSSMSSMTVQHDTTPKDFTSTFSINQLTTSESSISSPFFVMPFCGQNKIGLTCNISSAPCDMMQLCENNGTCINNNSIADGYSCSCSQGFNGSNCEIDNRPYQSNTCWNKGICNQTSDTTFECLCKPEWIGTHCEIQIDYCQNVTCLNNGVCQPLLGDYKCECLSKSYSGEYCGIISRTLVIRQTVSKSFGYICYLMIGCICSFFIVMDILKYCFGIDPAKDQLKRRRRRRQRMKKIKRPPQIQKFIYIN